MPVTSHDVARLAGVSQPTVSRALRPDGQASPATRERVRRAAETLGYVPSELGRSLSTRSTRQIAMVADVDNPLYPQLVGPLHDAFAAQGYRMVLLAERDEELGGDERLLDGSIDGAVLTTSQRGASLPLQLTERAVPFVQLNRVSDLVDADSVTADNALGGRLVADLMVGLGHREVGAVFGPKETSSAGERERGFRAGLRVAGVRLPAQRVVRGWFTYQAGFDGMRRLLEGTKRPTRRSGCWPVWLCRSARPTSPVGGWSRTRGNCSTRCWRPGPGQCRWPAATSATSRWPTRGRRCWSGISGPACRVARRSAGRMAAPPMSVPSSPSTGTGSDSAPV